MTATITIPMLPPPECSPNSRSHWRKKARATAAFREAARLAMVDALNTPGSGASHFCGYPLPVVLDIEVGWDGRRRTVDDDNLVAACKPARDGIADALWGGEDGHVRLGEVRQTRGEGTTTFVLREESDAEAAAVERVSGGGADGRGRADLLASADLSQRPAGVPGAVRGARGRGAGRGAGEGDGC